MCTTEQVYRQIGRRLREVREGQGLSQEDVAKQLGITSQGYGRWETAERRIPIAELRRIADFFGYPMAYFLGENLAAEELTSWQFHALSDEDKAFVREMIGLLDQRRRSAA